MLTTKVSTARKYNGIFTSVLALTHSNRDTRLQRTPRGQWRPLYVHDTLWEGTHIQNTERAEDGALKPAKSMFEVLGLTIWTDFLVGLATLGGFESECGC
jgi:hypothetical protein